MQRVSSAVTLSSRSPGASSARMPTRNPRTLPPTIIPALSRLRSSLGLPVWFASLRSQASTRRLFTVPRGTPFNPGPA